VGILGQSAGGVREFAERKAINFPLLLDPERSVIKAYGVYQFLWFDAFNIAKPALFVVDAVGVIRKIFVGGSQWDRPSTVDVLGALSVAAGPMDSGRV
jgi:peroxiredoxin